MSDLEPHEPESTHPISAAQPHRPADDTEQVYFEGSPVIRGAVKAIESGKVQPQHVGLFADFSQS